MSNVLYPKAKEAFSSGLIDWLNDSIKVVLVDDAFYTYDDLIKEIKAAEAQETTAKFRANERIILAEAARESAPWQDDAWDGEAVPAEESTLDTQVEWD